MSLLDYNYWGQTDGSLWRSTWVNFNLLGTLTFRRIGWLVISSESISMFYLTHWSRVTHIYVNKLTSINSDDDLSPGRRQVIIWPNAGLLSIGTLRTNFNEILSEIYTFSFKKCIWKRRLQNGGHFGPTSMCSVSLVYFVVPSCLLYIWFGYSCSVLFCCRQCQIDTVLT